MDVQRGTTALRDRSRVTTPGTGPTGPPGPSGSDTVTARASSAISLGNPRIPNRAEPNTNIDASITVTNNNLWIDPITSPNGCDPGRLFTGGSHVRVELLVNGTRVDQATDCVPGAGGSIEFPLTWTTPPAESDITKSVTYRAIGADNGDQFTDYSTSVTVTGSAPEQGSGGADEGGRDGGSGADDVQCRGLVDAIIKPECSFNDYVAQAGQGAMLMLVGFALVFVLAAAR